MHNLTRTPPRIEEMESMCQSQNQRQNPNDFSRQDW